jgi:hypothetical protein
MPKSQSVLTAIHDDAPTVVALKKGWLRESESTWPNAISPIILSCRERDGKGRLRMSNITYRSTSEELADPDGVSREHVLQRLSDWRDRVHQLYDKVERELEGTPFKSNREGKYTSAEEFPQRVGVAQREQPEIDVLRIIRPDNSDAAVFYPRGLWVVGANGRVDLRIKRSLGGTKT